MPINLQNLQASLAQVGEIAYDEITFDAGDHRITLRPVKSWEEQEVDHYARIAWEGKQNDDAAAFGEFLDRTRVGILSHALIEFNGLDLRGVEYIETGEQTEAGKPVELQKYKALRDSIYEWPRQVLHRAYLKYAEMMARVEVKAQAAIEIETRELDVEIERLEERLGTLRALKDDAEERAENPEPGAHRREAIANAGDAQQEQVDALRRKAEDQDFQRQVAEAEAAAASQQPPQPEPRAEAPRRPPERGSYPPMQDAGGVREAPRERRPGARQPITPQRGTAPSRPVPPQAQPEPEPPAQPEQQVETDGRGIPLPHEGDSFFDESDPAAAMRAEEARLRAFREQRQGRRPEQEPQVPAQGVIDPPIARGEPPHAQARRLALNVENATLDLKGDPIHTGRVDPRTGEEIAAVRLPTDVVSEDARGVPASVKKQEVRQSLNQRGTGTANPKFVAPGGEQPQAGKQPPKVWRDDR